MKLFKATTDSGKHGGSMRVIYVVAETYSVAERILLSEEDNPYWMWNHEHRILSIEELKEPVIGETP